MLERVATLHDLRVCEAVHGELNKEKTRERLDKCKGLNFPKNLEGLDTTSLQDRYPYLGPGEVNILALALIHKKNGDDYFCIFDEKRARKVAESLGLSFMGTIGLLRELEREGLLPREERIQLEAKLAKSPFYYKEPA